MRIAAILWCAAIPGLQVYLFRRIRDDLIKNHMEGPKGFRSLLAGWENAGFVKIVDDEIRFWTGAKIYLCHCKDEKDIYKYQGAEIHVLLIDELTHFTESMYRFLRNRVRMVGIVLPAEFAGFFPRILCGANPGNIGHLWVRRTFVDAAAAMERWRTEASEGGMLRQYIPARLEDNPSMAVDDPGYEQRLEGLGSKALVQAMRWGDWNVVDGAFFDNWDIGRHVIKPFEVPDQWLRFASGDWGSAKPFSFGWWAVVSDAYKTPSGAWLPRGCLVRFREWYGCKPGQENVGLKMNAEDVGKGLRDIEGTMRAKPSYRVLDPAAFAENGGPSIAEKMMQGSEDAERRRIIWRPADNTRVAKVGAMGGWDTVRARLDGDEEGRPMAVCFDTCRDSVRTIPAAQHDKNKPEDLDTDCEDHALDDWRYGCNSRPYVRQTPAAPPARDRWARLRTSGDEDSWRTV